MVHPKMGWVELKIREIRRKKKIEIDNNRYTNNVIKKVERDRKNAMWLKMRFNQISSYLQILNLILTNSSLNSLGCGIDLDLWPLLLNTFYY